MGHYYADLMCDACGKVRCTCPAKPLPSESLWAVWGYAVRPAKELSLAQRMSAPLFPTELQAKAALPAVLDAKIAQLEQELGQLRVLRLSCPSDAASSAGDIPPSEK